jgi:hypothetical protein
LESQLFTLGGYSIVSHFMDNFLEVSSKNTGFTN